MNSKELVQSLINGDFIKSELPLQMEMGLPFLKKLPKGVVICFKAHPEIREGNITYIYPAQYEIEWIYPFNHVSYFKNLSVYGESIDGEAICILDDETMFTIGTKSINNLYNELDNILDHLDETKTVSDVAIANYHKVYRKAVKELGLSQLYLTDE